MHFFMFSYLALSSMSIKLKCSTCLLKSFSTNSLALDTSFSIFYDKASPINEVNTSLISSKMSELIFNLIYSFALRLKSRSLLTFLVTKPENICENRIKTSSTLLKLSSFNNSDKLLMWMCLSSIYATIL